MVVTFMAEMAITAVADMVDSMGMEDTHASVEAAVPMLLEVRLRT